MNLASKKIAKFLLLLILFTVFPFTSYALSAESAIVMEVQTGRILYTNNINSKMPIASTTKIMTALLALEKGNVKSMVEIPREAVGIEGSSIYLRNKEKISLEDLVYGLMLRSGNDAAVAIAHYVGGTEEKFIEMMNKRAKEIGAKNTNFTNPHGLHNDHHYTTSYDLAIITRQALLNEEFKKISSTKRWTANREINNYFYNKNKTLTQFSGGDGVKIGYTKAAGRCLVSSATRDGMQLIAIVLNDYNWFNDCYQLLNNAFDRYKPYKVLTKGSPIKAYFPAKGKKEKSFLTISEDIIIPVSEEERNRTVTVFEVNKNIIAPIKKGAKLGKAKIYIDDLLLDTTDLIAIENIEEKKMLDYIIDFFN